MPSNRRIGQKTKDRFKKSWGNLVDGLSREVIVYLQENKTECPNCYYDKIHDRSSGIPKVFPSNPNYFTVGRCPVCRGLGVLTVSRKRCIKALVIWNPGGDGANALTFTEAGMEGATVVELKTDVCNLEIIRDSKYIVIDGIRTKLAKPPIIRGLGNKSVLIAHLFTGDKPRSGSGEYI